ncbi:hypothetical protein [Janthinobacterium sp. RB2P8]|uniref:hypothetical protein n=1 Tax=Janthinobacterium sp. RB2P8 TaxID=3424191 RepID=UPI003F21C680
MAKTHYSGDVVRNDMRRMQACVSLPVTEFNLLWEIFSGNCASRKKLQHNTMACFLAFSHFYLANFFQPGHDATPLPSSYRCLFRCCVCLECPGPAIRSAGL